MAPTCRKWGVASTNNQLTIRILTGGDNMPAYGSILTPQELNDLVAFLESRKSPGQP